MLGDWGKLIVAKGFKKFPKVQKIARSGHTDDDQNETLFRSIVTRCWIKNSLTIVSKSCHKSSRRCSYVKSDTGRPKSCQMFWATFERRKK